MKIKNIFSAALVCCGIATALTSCSNDEESFFTVSESDSPRILNTDFPDGGFSINRDVNLKFEVLVTPADFTTVKWYADGQEVFVGNTIDKAFEAGNYTIKIVAVTTQGKETSRTIPLTVKTLDGDPVTEDKVLERLQIPAATAKVSGSNMAAIKKISINGQQADVTSNANNYVEYTVPAGLVDGQYRLSLIDAEGNSYGGGLVTITSCATASKASFSAQTGGKLDIQGCKLNDVTEVFINGQSCTIKSKDNEKLTIMVPELEEGTYELKASTANGAVKFLNEGTLVEVASIKVSSVAEDILWEGNHAIDWGTPWEDSDSKATNFLKQNAAVGCTLRLYVKRTDSEYAKGCPAVGWADIVKGGVDPNRGDVDIAFTDNYIDFTLTAKSFELLNNGNLQVVGHGFNLLKITLLPSAETTLWEGATNINWGDANVFISAADMANVPVGATVSLYYEMIDAEYHSLRVTNEDWSKDIVPQVDGLADIPSPYEFEFTADHKAIADAKGMLVTGFGYKLTKVTVK